LPELLEVFLEQIRSDGSQVVAEQIAKAEFLLRGEVVFAFEDAPARLLQQRFVTLASHLAGLGCADLVQRLVHLGNDAERT